MSLSEQNRALIERVMGAPLWETGVPAGRAEINRLLDAARAEGVAALQQAGEPVAWRPIETAPKRPGWSNPINDFLPDNLGPLILMSIPFSPEPATTVGFWCPEYECWRHLADDGPHDIGPTHWKPFPLPQQTALVEQGVEKIIGPHEPAACGASAPSEPPRSNGWQDIASAPRDGTTIQARIPGHGSDNMIAWISDALDDGNGSCGAWTFVLEDQEPPSCWSDGWCWAVNEDGERSAEPTEWKPPMPEGEKP